MQRIAESETQPPFNRRRVGSWTKRAQHQCDGISFLSMAMLVLFLKFFVLMLRTRCVVDVDIGVDVVVADVELTKVCSSVERSCVQRPSFLSMGIF